MTAAAKKRNPLLLLGYASFTFGNMPLSLLEMTNVHHAGSRSNAVWPAHSVVPMQVRPDYLVGGDKFCPACQIRSFLGRLTRAAGA